MEVKYTPKSGTVTGTTTAAYVEALRIEGYGGVQGKTIFNIRNSGATNTIYYKIDAYLTSNPNCLVTNVTSQTSIAVSTTIQNTTIVIPYAVIVVSVVNNSGASTYQIDWINY
jgi:hypothetical protein